MRDAIGPDIELMAISTSRNSINIDIGLRSKTSFFLARESRARHTPAGAVGQAWRRRGQPASVFRRHAFRPSLERAVDIVMIDLFRVGGITNWLKSRVLPSIQSTVAHHLIRIPCI